MIREQKEAAHRCQSQTQKCDPNKYLRTAALFQSLFEVETFPENKIAEPGIGDRVLVCQSWDVKFLIWQTNRLQTIEATDTASEHPAGEVVHDFKMTKAASKS